MDQLSLTFEIPLALVSPDELYGHAESVIELLREDRRFERKSPKTSPRTLGEYFSMWANTPPDGGLIAVGIEDNGKIIGCKSLTQGWRSKFGPAEYTGIDTISELIR